LEPVSTTLFSLFKGNPNRREWVIACLEGTWAKLLGDRLAAVCRPVRFDDSDLSIEILEREWYPVFQSVKEELLDKLRAATAGEVRAITFKMQSLTGSR